MYYKLFSEVKILSQTLKVLSTTLGAQLFCRTLNRQPSKALDKFSRREKGHAWSTLKANGDKIFLPVDANGNLQVDISKVGLMTTHTIISCLNN